eukprot:jgi/Botrbrau1/2815/Bobra.0125s0025.1
MLCSRGKGMSRGRLSRMQTHQRWTICGLALTLSLTSHILGVQTQPHQHNASAVSPQRGPGASKFQDMLGSLVYSQAMIRVGGNVLSCNSTTGTYPFKGSGSWSSLYCLNNWAGSSYPGNAYLLYPCSPTDSNNNFDFYKFPNNDASQPPTYNIVSRRNYLCLDAGPTPGGSLTQQPCTTSLSQQFYLNNGTTVTNCTSAQYKYFTIQAASSSQCMTVGSSNPYSGAPVVFSACGATLTPQQTFFLDYFYGSYLNWSPPPPPPVLPPSSPPPPPSAAFARAFIRTAASALTCASTSPYFTVASPWALRCFNSWTGSTTPGTAVNLFTCDLPPPSNELWNFVLVSPATASQAAGYKIVNPSSSTLCIDAGDTSVTPYQLRQQTCTGASSQTFYLLSLGTIKGCPTTFVYQSIQLASTGQCMQTLSASTGSSPSFGTCSNSPSDATQSFFVDVFYANYFLPPPSPSPSPPPPPPPPPAPSSIFSQALLRVAGSALSCMASSTTPIVGSGSYTALRCIFSPSTAVVSGQAVTMNACDLPPPSNQVWMSQYVPETFPAAYMFTTADGQLCLDAGDTSAANYQLSEVACDGTPTQQFILMNPTKVTSCATTYLYYRLQVASSGECLTIPSTTAGASPVFAACSSTTTDPTQTFFIDGFWPSYLNLFPPPPAYAPYHPSQLLCRYDAWLCSLFFIS